MDRLIKISLLIFAFIFLSDNVGAQAPENFVVEEEYFSHHSIAGVCLDDNYLYLSFDDSLKVFDRSNQDTLIQVGACWINANDKVHKFDEFIVTSSWIYEVGIKLISISDPFYPRHIFTGDSAGLVFDPVIHNDLLFEPSFNWDSTRFRIYDLSDPENPTEVYLLAFDGYGGGMDFYQNNFYFLKNPMSSGDSTEVWIFSLTDPGYIQLIGQFTVDGSLFLLKVYGHFLFVAGGNLEIYDISVPSQPVFVFSDTLPPDYFVEGFEIRNGYMYCSYHLVGMILYDVGGWSAPELLGIYYHSGFPTWSAIQICSEDDIVYFAAYGMSDPGLFKLRYTGGELVNTGDSNHDGVVNAADVLYMVNYFKGIGDAPPEPQERGDTNGDCALNGLDVVYLVNYLKGGGEPIRGFCYQPLPE